MHTYIYRVWRMAYGSVMQGALQTVVHVLAGSFSDRVLRGVSIGTDWY